MEPNDDGRHSHEGRQMLAGNDKPGLPEVAARVRHFRLVLFIFQAVGRNGVQGRDHDHQTHTKDPCPQSDGLVALFEALYSHHHGLKAADCHEAELEEVGGGQGSHGTRHSHDNQDHDASRDETEIGVGVRATENFGGI